MASKYRNAGQTCVCTNRFLVQRGVRDAFVEKLAARVKSLKVGPGDEEGVDIGPLINEDAVEKVDSLVAGAAEAGAEIVLQGGRRGDGLYYDPTVLSGVTPDMDIFRTEIFGPVSSVSVFDDEEEAVATANDTIFGLASYFYTRDLGRAFRVAEALEYGMVGVNQGIVSNVAAPFGGIKQSGMGREGSHYGLDDYLEIKYIALGGLGA